MSKNRDLDKYPMVAVRLPRDVYDALRKLAEAEDRKMAFIVRRMVERNLKKIAPQKSKYT